MLGSWTWEWLKCVAANLISARIALMNNQELLQQRIKGYDAVTGFVQNILDKGCESWTVIGYKPVNTFICAKADVYRKQIHVQRVSTIDQWKRELGL